VTLVAISRAPFAKLDAYRKRLGWSFKWLSSAGNDFNFDYQVSFRPEAIAKGEIEYNYGKVELAAQDLPGISVFYKDGKGDIFHTYSCYARGIDLMNNAYQYLDLTPKGRDEGDGMAQRVAGLGDMQRMSWLRRNDEYKD
jgi:predicted dithiol-disulfide oxidoreductase (DUF899 family)